MNKLFTKTMLLSFAALMLSVATPAFADDIGYLDSATGVVKSGFDECWKAPNSPAQMAPECGDAPMPEPEPETGLLDFDGDGVPDYRDWCAGTPAGVEVDSRGCPLDSDGDGVPDYLDECPNTPANTRVDERGCPMAGSMLHTIEGVNFEFDSAQLKPSAKATLDQAVRVLRDNPGVSVAIEGHTDSTGPDAYNQGLSERRARSVRDYLVANGISAGSLRVVGKGESSPVASNDNAAGRAQNRRVDLVVSQ